MADVKNYTKAMRKINFRNANAEAVPLMRILEEHIAKYENGGMQGNGSIK